jgi:ATP-binding cassette subfamily B (MDR/TAP) protein 1
VKGSSLCPAEKRYSGGDIIGVFFCIFVPAMNIQQLAPSFKKISEGRVAAVSIFRVLDRRP